MAPIASVLVALGGLFGLGRCWADLRAHYLDELENG